MRLRQHTDPQGQPKYAVINLDRYPEAYAELQARGWLDPDETFVLKLKDMGTPPALRRYADFYTHRDQEYALEVRTLADEAAARDDAKWAD